MSKGTKASLGCLFWIALMLLVVVLFLFNQNNITAFIDRIRGNDTENPGSKPIVVTHGQDDENRPDPSESPDAKTDITVDDPSQPDAEENQSQSSSSSSSTFSSSSSSSSSDPIKKLVKNIKLYFVMIKDSDEITLEGVPRQINYDDAPLTETLRVLLNGPTDTEKKSSLQTLIPRGTLIKNVYVKGSTAYISFSEEFRFNSHGVPGLQAQLKQIVFTATEFSNIKQVQILINDKKVDYLAQEGVYIGVPLSRDTF